MKKQDVNKKDIKNYWEAKAPQTWYSNKNSETNTLSYFNEIAYQRYNVYYSFIPSIAEFEFHPGEKVLDIGVGLGTDIVSYAKNGAIVSGVDLTENAIEVTKNHLELFNLKAEKLVVADAENLPFDDNHFDVVYSFGVLHHTPNTEKAIAEALRVLKPGGKVIVMLYARGWKHYFKRLFISGILRGQLFKFGYDKTVSKNTEVKGNSPLTYVLKKKEIKKIFENAQSVNISIKRDRLGEFFDYAPYNTIRLPGFITKIFYFLGLEGIMGENYIIKAFKVDENFKSPTPKFSAWQIITNSHLKF